MPWCPKCGTEYRNEFDICADFQGTLVQQPVEQEQPERYSIISWLLQALSIPSVALLALLAFFPLYHAAFFLYEWVADNFCGLIMHRAIELYAALPASVLTGFIVGVIYNRKLSMIELSVGFAFASAILPVGAIIAELTGMGYIDISWQDILYFLPILLILLLPAGLAASRGRRVIAKNGWKQLVWLVSFTALLFAASLLMLPVYGWLNP